MLLIISPHMDMYATSAMLGVDILEADRAMLSHALEGAFETVGEACR
jgi:predicted thioesterase